MGDMTETSAIDQRLQHRLATESKHCPGCETTKSIREFYVRIRVRKETGRQFINVREVCKECHKQTTVDRRRRRPNGSIYGRYRRNAAEKGLQFSVSRTDFDRLLARDCHYCGASELLMTLDRADNDVGYTLENIVPACIRCNLLKADMPVAAWLELVPHIRRVYEAGKFGGWVPRNMRVNARQDVTR